MSASTADLLGHVQQHYGVTITSEMSWAETGLDSMHLLEVIFHAEQRYNLSVPDAVLMEIQTLADLCHYVDSQRPVPSA